MELVSRSGCAIERLGGISSDDGTDALLNGNERYTTYCEAVYQADYGVERYFACRALVSLCRQGWLEVSGACALPGFDDNLQHGLDLHARADRPHQTGN